MKQTTKWNQFESKEDLYLPLKFALWDTSHQKKRHKAYFLFSVLFLEAWWLKSTYSWSERRFVIIHWIKSGKNVILMCKTMTISTSIL